MGVGGVRRSTVRQQPVSIAKKDVCASLHIARVAGTTALHFCLNLIYTPDEF